MKDSLIKIPFLSILFPLSLGLFIFVLWQNNHITVTRMDFSSEKLPSDFDNFKILQISDLHNKEFGKNSHRLIKKIKDLTPDIIVITGDLVDSRRTDIDAALALVREAVKLAPVYYVPGNHESRSSIYKELFPLLEETGVTLLLDSKLQLREKNSSIELIGVVDPRFRYKKGLKNSDKNILNHSLSMLVNKDSEDFTLLLSHRPELIELYAEYDIDLVFSGHAHGGQVRLPFIGGLLAPGQGFFPKYTSGMHRVKNTTMIISRGLGNSAFPVRVFNRPELILVTLSSEK